MCKKNALLIISLSARPYVEAAKLAGFYVTAIDGFVDQETEALSDKVFTLDFNVDGFNAEALMQIVRSLDGACYMGCLFGGGFEARPGILSQIAEIMPVLGNAVDVIAAVKSPHIFFKSLSDLNINFPELIDADSQSTNAELRVIQKRIGGSGGQHISWVDLSKSQSEQLNIFNPPDVYHQAYVEGQAISVLFLAGASDGYNDAPVAVIGFNQQWVSGDERQPFKLGGIVSHVVLKEAIEQQIERSVQNIVEKFNLIGLNSLDVIVSHEEIYVLEVNPRLSASLALYLQDYLDEMQVNLLMAHINICAISNKERSNQAVLEVNAIVEDLISFNLKHCQTRKLSKAFAVVYAVNDCMIDNKIDWPEWVKDSPRCGMTVNNAIISQQMQFKKGMPICSVVANGADWQAAKVNVNGRVNYIKSLLHN